VLLARSFYACVVFLLFPVKLEVYVVAGNKMKLLICPYHFEARRYWKHGQDLLVGVYTTVLPATGWQCLTKKPNQIETKQEADTHFCWQRRYTSSSGKPPGL